MASVSLKCMLIVTFKLITNFDTPIDHMPSVTGDVKNVQGIFISLC